MPSLLQPKKQAVDPLVHPKRVIVIAGPTATGKSQLALELAQGLGGEIISADSMQVYRNLDIGTAKPTLNERVQVPHHMVDICDLSTPFNAAEFSKLASQSIFEIWSHEHVPIVVGGSGFYLHTLLYGPPAGPSSHPELRQQLEMQMELLGAESMYEQLQMVDPEYAATISERDRHKVIRALEIISLSSQKVSDFPKPEERFKPWADFRCWFIYYPKEILYQRIDQRCLQMVNDGLLDEVRTCENLGLRDNSSAAQAIGYRQALEYLEGDQNEKNFRLFVEKFQRASRQYAKRQFTWFRKAPLFCWLNIAELGIDRVRELISHDFEQR